MKREILLARYRFAIFWVLSALIFLAGVVGAGAWYYRNQKENLRADVWEDLNAIADLKTSEIAEWRRSRLREADLLADDARLAPSVELLLGNKPGGKQATATVLEPYRRHTHFGGIAVVDAASNVIWSNPAACADLGTYEKAVATESASKETAIFSDLFLNKQKQAMLLIAVPVIGPQHSAIAVVLLFLDPNSYLFPLINSWPTPSRTAETLLVRRDGDSVLFLNRLRHTNHPPLTLRLPLSLKALPAAWAALQRQGTLEGIDYRGVPVLSVTRRIPDSKWGMVTKIDLDESYAVANRMARATLLQVGLIVSTLALAAALILATHVARLRKKAEGEIRRSHQELEKRVAERTVDLRRLTGYLEDVHEEQSKRISEEIHDQLGSNLTAARLQLLSLEAVCEQSKENEAAVKLRSVAELIGNIQADVRRISRGLRPPALDHLGLAAALETLLEEFRERTGIECAFTVGLDHAVLPDGDWSVSVYRIFQEALTNVARHAAATRVDACLTAGQGNLLLEIRDNGKGFDPKGRSAKSCGMLGMRERAARLGGELSFVPLQPTGTSVQARFPLPDQPSPEPGA